VERCRNIVQSFGGTLTSETKGDANVTRLTLVPSAASR
jgi:hypothetical protein